MDNNIESYFDQFDQTLTINLTDCLNNYSTQNNYSYNLSNSQSVIVTISDIFSNIGFVPNYLQSNYTQFTPYTILDSQRIDIISNILYGSPDYWWVIAMINQNTDIIHQFTTTDNIIRKIASKYSLLENIYPLSTYYTLLENQNESSRNILVLQSAYLTEFISQFITIIQQQANTP